MKVLKKSLILALVMALLLSAFTFGFSRKTIVFAESSARVFDSEASFSDVVNGNNNFYAMYGEEGKVDTFKLCTNKLADSSQQYWQGSQGSYNLVGKTKMLIGLPNNEVSVRAFKAPLSGKVNLVLTAFLDSEAHENTENLQVYFGTTLQEDFAVSSTTEIVKNYSVDLTKGGYIFVSLHDNNGGNVSNTATHVKMVVTYTSTTDANVLALNTQVNALTGVDAITYVDYQNYKNAYTEYNKMTALEQSFIEGNQKLLSGYDKALGLYANQQIEILPSNLTNDNLQEINALYAMVSGMTDSQKAYISASNMTKYNNAVALSQKMLELNSLYDLIDNLPNNVTLIDKYQVAIAHNKYLQLDEQSLSIIDKQREEKLLNAVKTIYDLENPSSSSSSSSSVSSASSSISSQAPSVSQEVSCNTSVSSKESVSSNLSSQASVSSKQEVSSVSQEQSTLITSQETSIQTSQTTSIQQADSSSIQQSVTPTPAKRGCKSNVGANTIIFSAVAVLALVCLLKKKEV